MADRVMHFEVHGRDGKRSQEFYASLFGWKVDASNPMNYGLVSPEPGAASAVASRSRRWRRG